MRAEASQPSPPPAPNPGRSGLCPGALARKLTPASRSLISPGKGNIRAAGVGHCRRAVLGDRPPLAVTTVASVLGDTKRLGAEGHVRPWHLLEEPRSPGVSGRPWPRERRRSPSTRCSYVPTCGSEGGGAHGRGPSLPNACLRLGGPRRPPPTRASRGRAGRASAPAPALLHSG